jgi:SAM-dependent methyltransferase
MRTGAFGESGLTVLDRLGNWLSLRAIRRHLVGIPHPYIVDLGSGYRARLLRALKTPGITAHAIDLRLDPDLKAIPGFVATEASIPEALVSMPSNFVDVVLLISVLEHLHQPGRVREECHRVLKPNGRMLINVPTWRGRWFLELAAFRLGLSPAQEMDDHKLYYNIPTLWPMLVSAGFKPSRIKVKPIKFGLTLFGVAQKNAASLPLSCEQTTSNA